MNGAVFKSVLIDEGKEKAHTLSFPAALPPSPGWASWEGGREKVHSQAYQVTVIHSRFTAPVRLRLG